MNSQNKTKKYTFHVDGMHCNACVLLTETNIKELPEVQDVHASLQNHSVEVVGDFQEKTDDEIANILTRTVEAYGYHITTQKLNHDVSWSDFKFAIPITLGFVLLFILLQKLGIMNLVGGGNVTYGTAFVIGIVASLSTCMAVVGGLLLSMSATFAKSGNSFKPQLMFQAGRVISFFIFGGIIGALGSAFTLNTTATFIMSLIIGVVMLILGINLLEVFPGAKRLQFSMPNVIAKRAHGVSKFNHTFTPLLVGIVTFFLPCGFTQSMQIYTLSTGGFIQGGLTMLSFALGTLPVLALISFSSFKIQDRTKSGIFFKSAGLIVILFALFNIINSLVVVGIIPPIFNF